MTRPPKKSGLSKLVSFGVQLLSIVAVFTAGKIDRDYAVAEKGNVSDGDATFENWDNQMAYAHIGVDIDVDGEWSPIKQE